MKLLRTHPFPGPRTETLHGVPAPLHLPFDHGCRCYTWPRHRLMADGHRPYCLARPTDDDKIVVDVEIAPDGRPYIERLP